MIALLAALAAPAARPAITPWYIPFPARRRAEMARYSERHYGQATWRLSHPRVIVEHLTETVSAGQAWNAFAPDVPDPELHELPGVCAHFLIARDGTIFALVGLAIRCRHTVGLNWTAIGIEDVASTDAQVLADPAQLRSSLRLTRWLRCRYSIPVADVIGHHESLSSPFHHERVPALRTQTHDDWQAADMRRYRALLVRQGGC